MRADRLLSILLLLQMHGRMTARELAGRLEVSERTILRDMDALSTSGVPVIAERGQGGGWMLGEGYQTRLTGLNQGEIQALFLAQPAHLLKDLGLHQASESALVKLMASVPKMFRHSAEFVRQRIHVDLTAWKKAGESPEHLPLLQDAVLGERKIRFTYQRGDGTVSERLSDPLGLVAKGSVWYLVAMTEGEVRTYRANRILAAEVTEETAQRPLEFDLAAYWAASAVSFVESLPQYPVKVRARHEILRRLTWAGRFSRVEQVGEVGPDGWAEVQIRFEEEGGAVEYALSFGDQIEILEPVHLRELVVERARSVINFYSCKARN